MWIHAVCKVGITNTYTLFPINAILVFQEKLCKMENMHKELKPRGPFFT